MMNRIFISTSILFLTTAAAYSQGTPPPPQGMPGGGRPPRGGEMRPEGDRQRPLQQDWMKGIDTNNDDKIDAAEFTNALQATFTEIDRNSNGMIDANEMPRTPRPDGPPMGGRPQGPPPAGFDRQGPPPRPEDMRDGPRSDKMLPPFFFADRMDRETSTSRAEFEKLARSVFAEMDRNGDGVISLDESHPPRRPDGPPDPRTPPPPNGQFVAAELRFGDRLVPGQPFSAETVIEDTRRLYDGTTVTKANHGAIYRDSSGRTRREQPLEMVGGVGIAGADGKPQTLVFINDFASGDQYFLDVNNKIARKHKLGKGPEGDGPGRPGEKTESLGTKTIEGVQVEGTRSIFEIPAGHLGNDKPIQVVTENWYSPELQMIVYSKHTDPLAGEHIFKLTNIKRGEQSAELFAIPAGFKIETPRAPRPEEE